MKKKSLAAAIGAGIATTLSIGTANAAENPFAMKDLASGYTQLAEAGEAKKPEVKCGAEVMKNNPEMKCGASMMDMSKMDSEKKTEETKKAVEMKCAGMKMDKPAEAPKQ
jgi:uncharacterized low-complexity protein